MDALTHTILALGCVAGAYYGGRWLQLREFREARHQWRSLYLQLNTRVKKEMAVVNDIIQQMSQEDQDYVNSLSAEDYQQPLQLELFKEYTEYGHSPSE